MPHEKLNTKRKQIDDLDNQLLAILQKRNQIVKSIIETKIQHQLPIFIPERENEKINSFCKAAQQDFSIDSNWAEDLIRMIMGLSRNVQSQGDFPRATDHPKSILFVGGDGSMGRLYARMARVSGHNVRCLDKDDWEKVEQLTQNIDLVIIAVPIQITEEIIRKIAPHLGPDTILSDFTSMKKETLPLMLKVHLGPVVALHPMHGPDVSNLSRQLMLVADGRGSQDYQWMIKQFILWGMLIKNINSTEHDKTMDLIQGLRHFETLLHASFLMDAGFDPQDILSYSSPIYRIELMMVGRIFAQNPELYAEIVFASEDRIELLKKNFIHHKKLMEIVENVDKQAFVQKFKDISDFLGEFSQQARKESSFLIDRLSERFS